MNAPSASTIETLAQGKRSVQQVVTLVGAHLKPGVMPHTIAEEWMNVPVGTAHSAFVQLRKTGLFESERNDKHPTHPCKAVIGFSSDRYKEIVKDIPRQEIQDALIFFVHCVRAGVRSMNQVHMLASCHRNGELSQTQLCEDCDIWQASVPSLARHMEALGLIKTTRNDLLSFIPGTVKTSYSLTEKAYRVLNLSAHCEA